VLFKLVLVYSNVNATACTYLHSSKTNWSCLIVKQVGYSVGVAVVVRLTSTSSIIWLNQPTCFTFSVWHTHLVSGVASTPPSIYLTLIIGAEGVCSGPFCFASDLWKIELLKTYFKYAVVRDLYVRTLTTAFPDLQCLLHFAWVVDDAKCIVVTRVCVSVCLSVCVSVCLSAAVCPYYCTDTDVTWDIGRGCP